MTTLSCSSPRPLDLPNARRYQSLIAEIDFSFSGRMDTYNYNTFLAESAFMLRNAIQVFQLGYFDAACYYLRESIEISTVGLYLTDLPKDDRRQYQINWVKRDWFPAQNKAMSKLKQYGRNFADFPDKMPELFSKIDLCTKGDADDIPYLTGSGRRIEHVFAG